MEKYLELIGTKQRMILIAQNVIAERNKGITIRALAKDFELSQSAVLSIIHNPSKYIPTLPEPIAEDEEWKPLPFEGWERYKVSNYGRVMNIDGTIKKTHINKDTGYEFVTLVTSNGHRGDRKYKAFTVHRAVALCFVEGYQEGLEVNHIDGCRTNNHYSNLEWCTKEWNNNEPIRKQRLHDRIGRVNPILQIDKEGKVIAEYINAHRASKETGINEGNIYQALKNNRSTAGGYIWKRK